MLDCDRCVRPFVRAICVLRSAGCRGLNAPRHTVTRGPGHAEAVRPSLLSALMGLACIAGAGSFPAQAQAAFPGRNGRIAYEMSITCGSECTIGTIETVLPSGKKRAVLMSSAPYDLA